MAPVSLDGTHGAAWDVSDVYICTFRTADSAMLFPGLE